MNNHILSCFKCFQISVTKLLGFNIILLIIQTNQLVAYICIFSLMSSCICMICILCLLILVFYEVRSIIFRHYNKCLLLITEETMRRCFLNSNFISVLHIMSVQFDRGHLQMILIGIKVNI